MSLEIRTEALRMASHLGGEPERVVKAAEQFFAFLNGKQAASSKSAEQPETPKISTSKVETAKVETKTETSVEPKTEKKPETETIDAKVARLAKELLNKSRPKLIAALKELGVERARDLKPDQLAKAAEAFEKAVKEA